MPKARKKDRKTQLILDLSSEYARWNDVYKNGCSDPFWTDGMNLELIRNHIIWYKKRIEAEMDQSEYPDDYYRDLPREVPMQYMAKADGYKRLLVHQAMPENGKLTGETKELPLGQLSIWDFIDM